MSDLLKCFCNCTDYTYEEISKIEQMSRVCEVLENERASRLLTSFLKMGTITADPLALNYVQQADICSRILAEKCRSSVSEDDLNILEEMCSSGDNFRKLQEARKSQTIDKLHVYCDELRSWLHEEIEQDPKWRAFRAELRRKLGL